MPTTGMQIERYQALLQKGGPERLPKDFRARNAVLTASRHNNTTTERLHIASHVTCVLHRLPHEGGCIAESTLQMRKLSTDT